jgi:membrane associated rhomboid family serine protease
MFETITNTKRQLFFSFFYPTLFVVLLWCIKLFEIIYHVSLAHYGLFPRTKEGLLGIITSPLLHGDVNHLLANTLPLLILGPIIFYFYRSIAFQLFFWIYISTGIWVWAAARNSYHIGASGIIYGFESFLFFSGVFRKNPRLLALSLFVVFLYGSTIWGILPVQKGISWESHALGALAGLITAYNFRKEGPPDKTYDLGNDDENESIEINNDEEPEYGLKANPEVVIHYHYVEEMNKNKEEENKA